MKKYIYVVAGGMLLFQLSDALKLSQYYDFQEKRKTEFSNGFDESTDLVRGLVVLQNDVLKGHRHYGNAEFDPYSMKSAEVCSYKDKSDDAMTQLLILTFPSAGAAGFSAYGEGSIGDIFTDADQHMQLIAGMFKIANETRNRVKSGATENDCIDVIMKKAKNERIDNDDYEKAVLSHFGFNSLLGLYNNDLSFKIRPIKILKNKVESIGEKDINELLAEIQLLKMIYGSLQKSEQLDLDNFKKELKNSVNRKRWKNVKHLPDCVNKLANSVELDNFINCLNRIEKLGKELKGADKKDETLKRLDQTQDNLIKVEKNVDYERIYKLFDLAKAVAGAVLLERLNDTNRFSNEKLKKYPYYIGYTNNIICAYACSVINTNVEENLAKLAGYLSLSKEDQQVYESELTKKMKEYYDKYPSYIPFDAGSTPITNGSDIPYKDHKFADCVETTMRQLFTVLLCSKKGKDGEWTEDLHLETSRIPNSGKLHDFFLKYSKADEAANGGNTFIREAWADVCSGHQEHNIVYDPRRKECELQPEWKNMIRLFCLLMSGYDAEEDTEQYSEEVKSRKQKAAELIREINEHGFDATDEKGVIDTLNILLGIRGDVQFEAINPHLSINNRGKIFGKITICPKTYTDGTKQIKPDNNKVCFHVSGGHACVDKIEKVEDPLLKVEEKKDDKIGVNYIRNLYSGRTYMLKNQFPIVAYYLKSRMLDDNIPDISGVMRCNLSGQYNKGLYRFYLAARENFPDVLNSFFRDINDDTASKTSYLALGKTFLDYNQDDPLKFSYYWKNISKFMNLRRYVDQSTKEQLYTKWSRISTIDDIRGLDCFLADYSSIDASIIKNLEKVKDWKMDLEDWITIGRIFNRINFTGDEQYSNLKPILVELQDAAKNFILSNDYKRSLVLTKDFTGKEEILKIVLPFCLIGDQNIINKVKDWIAEKETQGKVDEDLIIPVVGYLSDSSFEKFLTGIINQKKDYFERSLRHIVIMCHRNNEEREKKVSNLILSKFPADKLISESLAAVIAGQVDDIPALVKKVNIKDKGTLKTVFTSLGKKEREDCFIRELVKTQKHEDLIESIFTLSSVNAVNLGSRAGNAFIANKMNIPLSVAKCLADVGSSDYDWLSAVEELYESTDNISELLCSSDSEFLADGIGKMYVERGKTIPLPVAKILIKAGASGDDWLEKVPDILEYENISEILEISEQGKRHIADSIGGIHVEWKKPISMQLAKTLIAAGSSGGNWLGIVEKLSDSDENINELLRLSSTENKPELADVIGELYTKEKRPMSIQLVCALLEAGALKNIPPKKEPREENNDRENRIIRRCAATSAPSYDFARSWLPMVDELYNSDDNVIMILDKLVNNKSDISDTIGDAYAKRKVPISMRLAKILVKFGAYKPNWIHTVDEIYSSVENATDLIKEAKSPGSVANAIGEAYANKKVPISMQLAKTLVKVGKYSYDWIYTVDEIYGSFNNVTELIREAKSPGLLASAIGEAYANKKVPISMQLAKTLVESGANRYDWIYTVDEIYGSFNNVTELIREAKSPGSLADTIGEAYANKKVPVSMQLAKTLVKSGGRGDRWIHTVGEIYSSVANVTDLITEAKSPDSVADAIGEAYANKKVPISMQLAKTLVKFGAYKHKWIHIVDEIYDSVENVTDLINEAKFSHGSLADTIGEAYANKKVPISMQLAKTLVKFGGHGDRWIHAVDEIYGSVENTTGLIKEAELPASVAEVIGKMYAKRNMPISMQLAKVLIEAGVFSYDWLGNVENLFDQRNTNELLRVAGRNRDYIARKIAELKRGV